MGIVLQLLKCFEFKNLFINFYLLILFYLNLSNITQGSGWWKFEFCYGRSVEQYHVEQDNTRTTVKLGVFNREAHIAWLTHNPHKRPKPLPERRQLSHYYGGGSLCDKTGLPRETEVCRQFILLQKLITASTFDNGSYQCLQFKVFKTL